MKFLIGTLAILVGSFLFKQQVDLNGKSFHWKKSDKEFYNGLEESIIEFVNDSVKIIDFSPTIGALKYRLGTYKVNNKTLKIECQINKSIGFSTNIGQVISCTKQSQDMVSFKYSAEGYIIRQKSENRVQINSDGKWENTGILQEMKYKTFDIANPPISYDWVYDLRNYDNQNKLKNCNCKHN